MKKYLKPETVVEEMENEPQTVFPEAPNERRSRPSEWIAIFRWRRGSPLSSRAFWGEKNARTPKDPDV